LFGSFIGLLISVGVLLVILVLILLVIICLVLLLLLLVILLALALEHPHGILVSVRFLLGHRRLLVGALGWVNIALAAGETPRGLLLLMRLLVVATNWRRSELRCLETCVGTT
jgi:hypothetical protein